MCIQISKLVPLLNEKLQKISVSKRGSKAHTWMYSHIDFPVQTGQPWTYGHLSKANRLICMCAFICMQQVKKL